MKLNKILLPVVASAMLLTGCKDQIMEWGTPDGHTGVTKSEIPLAVKEVLANYDNIKTYSAENHPGMVLGLGIGRDIYMGEDGRHDLAAGNFQMVTWGNAMKMDAMVSNTGALNTAALEPALDALKKDGLALYGHNFFWHTQQNQTYLKAQIAPELVVETDSDIKNQLKNGSFDTDLSGWMGWGNNSTREWDATGGTSGSGAAKIVVPKSGNQWDVQFCQDLSAPLEVGKTYKLRFKARTDGAGHVQCCMQQPSNGYPAVGYQTFEVGTSWVTCEKEITVAEGDANAYTRLCINTGADIGTYWIDDVEFGEMITGPTNYCDNGSFENGSESWTLGNGASGMSVVELDDAIDGIHVLKAVAGESSNYWDVQVTSPTMPTWPGEKVRISFFIKSDQPGQARVSYPSSSEITNQWPWVNWTGKQSSWTEAFETSTSWLEVNYVMQNYSHDFVDGASTWRFCIDLGKLPGVTYYIDNVKVTLLSEEEASGTAAPRRASKMYYVLKTAEEKRVALLEAMESWVKGMAEYLASKEIVPVGYDVINEAIADGNNKVRGVDNVFGASDGDGNYDSEPVENTTDGLELNWASGHFYWGYYVKDYAVKAFEYARQYLPAETKLFYNDYNLETSDAKRAAAIKFVQDIDAAHGSAIVDGIGTQMHITLSGTSDDADNNAEKIAALRAQVDKQFQELAATGKLIRVTELDISLGTSSPSSAQYKAQSDAYKTIFESYFENVPEAQQSGITIWSLTDAEDEHEYWLKGETPNLFDASFLRKWAYKGVCDALAGEDLGLKLGGESYKTYYEKQNVSDTVK